MFKAVAPREAYIFDKIISSYIHIGSISLCLNNSYILRLTGAGFNIAMYENKVSAPSVEVTQDENI